MELGIEEVPTHLIEWLSEEDEREIIIRDNVNNTQKPVEINQRVLENFTQADENVLDLFGWSWSNLIACEKTGRRCFMMELDPKYAQVIVQRYVEYMGSIKNVYCKNRQLDIEMIVWQDE